MPDTPIETIIPLAPEPGTNRDNTKFAKNNCVDTQWCRFYYGRPKKIGGYNAINNRYPDIQRGAASVSENGINRYFSGDASNLYVSPINNQGIGTGLNQRTPAGFIASPNNVWQFDTMFDVGSSAKLIFASAGQNLAAIDSTVDTPVYYGDATLDNIPLLAIPTAPSVSGGVCVIHPYPMIYGNDGYIAWPAPGTIDFTASETSGSLRITGSKIIKGQSIRGGAGYSPSGLFWSLDGLNRVYFVGSGTVIFANDFVGKTYLLSSSAVVEYNGMYFWPSADGRFCMYNGSIIDMPNNFNLQYFFKNLNWQYRQKVWGQRIAAFQEIWWHYPSKNATECDSVLIFNYKDNIWYDTFQNRSCGVPADVFPYPMMWDTTPDVKGNYRLWQHEIGTDEVDTTNATVNAIPSYFESNIQTMVGKQGGQDTWTRLEWFEQDFLQTGGLTLNVTGEDYPESPNTVTYPDIALPQDPTDKAYVKQQLRLLRVKITSNVAGGDYYMGKPLLMVKDGNRRQNISNPAGAPVLAEANVLGQAVVTGAGNSLGAVASAVGSSSVGGVS